MHTKKSKRRDLAKRILTYVVMTASVFIAVGICIFLVLGYNVDEKTGKAEQGGLIQFRTFPANAKVKLDNNLLGATTPTKSNANAGEHTVNITLDKYREWNKKFTLDKAELLWLNALLVPKSITTAEVHSFDSLAGATASPNKKWIAVIEKTNQPILKIVDIRDEKKPKVTTLTVPAAVADTKTDTDTYEIAEWDFGSKYLLLKHTSGATVEWLRVDTTNEDKSVNISEKLDLDVTQVHFSGNSGNVFYALAESGSLRKLDIDKKTISSPIVENIREFELYKDDRIVYVGQHDGEQTVGIYKEGIKKPVTIKKFKKPDPVHAAIADYYSDMYLVMSDTKKAEIYKDPLSGHPLQTFGEFSLDSGINWLYFSNNGQFIIAQNGVNLASYNLERKESFHFAIPGATEYTSDKHLKWLDDFHLWSDAGGTLSIIEFDGSNPETIGNTTAGYDVTLSDNGKRLFSFGLNEATKKPVLQSATMVIE